MQAGTFSPNQSKSECNHPSGYLPVVSFFGDSGYFKTIFKSRVLFFPLTPPPKTILTTYPETSCQATADLWLEFFPLCFLRSQLFIYPHQQAFLSVHQEDHFASYHQETQSRQQSGEDPFHTNFLSIYKKNTYYI